MSECASLGLATPSTWILRLLGGALLCSGALAQAPRAGGAPAQAELAQDDDPQPSRPDLAELELEELRTLASQVGWRLFELLTSVDESVRSEQLPPDHDPRDRGVVRLLERDRFANLLEHYGSGAFYSFDRRTYDYQQGADLRLERGQLIVGAWGGDVACAMELGPGFDLDQLDPEGGPPEGLLEAQKRAWEELWRGYEPQQTNDEVRAAGLAPTLERQVEVRLGSTYLARLRSEGHRDHVFAVQVLEREEDKAITLGWRILRRWSPPGGVRPKGPAWDSEARELPSWVRQLGLTSCTELMAELRRIARPRLLEVAPSERQQFLERVELPTTYFGQGRGFARLLPRDTWEHLLGLGHDGSYYSFVRRAHGWTRTADLGLSGDQLRKGYGEHWLLDLGPLEFDATLRAFAGVPPETLSEREQAAWELCWTARAKVVDGERQLAPELVEAAADSGLAEQRACLVGHTYLARSILAEEHDRLVIFTVFTGDPQTGVSLVWRELKGWAVEHE